jgi:hypothetical protein
MREREGYYISHSAGLKTDHFLPRTLWWLGLETRRGRGLRRRCTEHAGSITRRVLEATGTMLCHSHKAGCTQHEGIMKNNHYTCTGRLD